MKKFILIFCWIALTVPDSFCQNPGNVGTTNLTAWFKPDALALGNVTGWTTTFPTGGAAITVTDGSAPFPLATNTPAGSVSNYNTTIEFTNNTIANLKGLENSSALNLLDNSSAGDQGTFFAAYHLPVTTQNDHMMLYNEAATQPCDAIQLRSLGPKGRLAIGRQSAVSANVVRDWFEDFVPTIISYKGNRSSNTSMSAFENSKLFTLNPTPSQSSGSQGLYFGILPGITTSPYNGYLHEFIFYNTDLTNNDIVKVNTYLAVKYRATLDNAGGGTQGDYVATDGTIIWDASVSPTYHNDVIGIGRDGNQALLQKQSHTFDDTSRVYLNTLQTTNTANTGIFSADVSYVVIGDDGGKMCSSVASKPKYQMGALLLLV